MTEPGDSQALSGPKLALFLACLTTKALVFLIVLAAISIMQMLRLGVNGRYLWLLAGSVLSIMVLIAYQRQVMRERGQPRRSVVGAMTGFGGFIPYLFGCYLVFY
jgi:hypothetical protein